jgi:hypothetical protein
LLSRTVDHPRSVNYKRSANFLNDGLGRLNHSAYSPVIYDTTHHLDTAVRTINALHQLTPFDFGMVLGDNGNALQFNELRWFIDVVDGQQPLRRLGRKRGEVLPGC